MNKKKKILIVSMPSIHVTRWIENIPDTYEIHWFDILDRGSLDGPNSVFLHINWKKRNFSKVRGAHTLKKYVPFLYNTFSEWYNTSVPNAFLELLEQIKPDIVQSFNLQHGAFPILKAMNRKKDLPWILNCWGNDIYYFQKFKKDREEIKDTLSRVDYFTADCYRDYELAKTLGFRGVELPMIPGGGGYKVKDMLTQRKLVSERKIILVKGYHHIFGRALYAIKALETIVNSLQDYHVILFGAHPPVIDYIEERKLPFQVYSRHGLEHKELIKLMGESLLYIGNNISDGMPNTLLEAIIMGAFPIQSNPGEVTAEIIENGVNGLLIENPEDSAHIAHLILQAINTPELIKGACDINEKLAIERLDYNTVRRQIQAVYI